MPFSAARFRTLAVLAARAAEDKKGEDIALLGVGRLTSLAEYLLLVTVTSPAHLEAVEATIEEAVEDRGAQRLHRDGRASEVWRVLDYGGLIVHLMKADARRFYALDKLFHGARRVPWGRTQGLGGGTSSPKGSVAGSAHAGAAGEAAHG